MTVAGEPKGVSAGEEFTLLLHDEQLLMSPEEGLALGLSFSEETKIINSEIATIYLLGETEF